IIVMEPNKKEFWRVVNSATEQQLNLQLNFVNTPTPMELIALDGIPLPTPVIVTTLSVPPAGRAEFIVQAPPPNFFGSLIHLGADTRPSGDPNPPQFIVNAQTADGTQAVPGPKLPSPSGALGPQRFAGLRNATPTTERRLY